MPRKQLEREEELAARRRDEPRPETRENGAREVQPEPLRPHGAAALSPRERTASLLRADENVRADMVRVAQRGAGNATVARTLARDAEPAPRRDEDTKLDAPEEEKKPDEIFERLPPGTSWLSGHGPNRAAEEVEKHLEEVVEQMEGVRSTLAWLRQAETKLGPESFKTVEAARPALEKKTEGVKGERLNDIVLKTANASANLSSKLYNVTAAEKDVVVATNELKIAVLDKNLLEGRREEVKVGEEVKAVEAKIEKSKEWAGAIFDAAIDALTGDWKGALKDLGKFAGKELLANWMVDEAYSKELEAAKKKLEAVKAKVTGLEDERVLLRIATEVERLEVKKNHLKSAQKELLIAAREAKATYKVFETRLSAMGKAGKAAADAIETREDVANMALLASEELTTYKDTVTKFKGPLDKAHWAYFNYRQFLNSPGGENLVGDPEIRRRLDDRVLGNQNTVYELKTRTDKELEDIASEQAWVAEGSYMAEYDAIDTMLAEVAGGR